MSQKIYVSNLPMSAVNETVAEKFAKFGIVYSAKVTNEKEANHITRSAFVEMAFSEDAQLAIRNLDGSTFDGYLINVMAVKKPLFH